MRTIVYGMAVLIGILSGAGSAFSAEVLMVTWGGKFPSETAFEKRLKELKPGVKFRYVKTERKKGKLAQALRSIDLSKIDLVYSFGTTGTKIVKQFLQGKKPQVFNIVSAPVLSKIANSIEKPGNNLTGARFLIDINTQLDILGKMRDYKTLGIYFDPREKQNATVLAEIKKYAEKHGKHIKPIRIIPDSKNFDKMLDIASKQANKLDALYFIASSSYASHYKKMHSKLRPDLLVMGSISVYVEAGSTVAVGAVFEERGKAVAEQAAQILDGKAAGDIPISLVTEKNATLFINKQKMLKAGLKNVHKLGLTIKLLDQQ